MDEVAQMDLRLMPQKLVISLNLSFPLEEHLTH